MQVIPARRGRFQTYPIHGRVVNPPLQNRFTRYKTIIPAQVGIQDLRALIWTTRISAFYHYLQGFHPNIVNNLRIQRRPHPDMERVGAVINRARVKELDQLPQGRQCSGGLEPVRHVTQRLEHSA